MEKRRGMYRVTLKKINILPIAVEELSLIKQSEKILKNINLDISSKGITFIIGPNGAGKTQLLRCLHGLEKYSGLIKYGDQKFSEEIKLMQSFVFQQHLLPDCSGESFKRKHADKILYPLQVNGRVKKDKHIQQKRN